MDNSVGTDWGSKGGQGRGEHGGGGGIGTTVIEQQFLKKKQKKRKANALVPPTMIYGLLEEDNEFKGSDNHTLKKLVKKP